MSKNIGRTAAAALLMAGVVLANGAMAQDAAVRAESDPGLSKLLNSVNSCRNLKPGSLRSGLISTGFIRGNAKPTDFGVYKLEKPFLLGADVKVEYVVLKGEDDSFDRAVGFLMRGDVAGVKSHIAKNGWKSSGRATVVNKKSATNVDYERRVVQDPEMKSHAKWVCESFEIDAE